MPTAEEGGATGKTTTTTSSYGGGGEGGAGGKFRKKPFRRPTTPYDRPPTALRRNDNSGSWLTKLVVDPASKLISNGAHRLFASVFRKSLPPPPAPQTSELNHGSNDGLPEALPHTQYGAQEATGGECSQLINSSSSISDLEQLLKQKTFTKSEIDHLTVLLQSRAGEVSLRDDGKRNEETASKFGSHQRFASSHQRFASSPSEGNRNEEYRSHGDVSTPISNSKVLEDGFASPAELAKAYMGSRSLKVSPSMLGMHSHVSREDSSLLSSTRFTSKSPIMSLTAKTSVGLGASENGFKTPRSRGRSAIYNMSRPLSSRVHPTSTLKGDGVKNNGYARLTTSPAPVSLVGPDERLELKPMSLKRRSSVLDDDVGSVSSIRRIRQKSNLMAPRIPHTAHGVETDSDAVLVSSKQKFPLIGEQKNVTNTVGKNADKGGPSTSYAPVPSKSSEVAAKILQHLEKMTPKQKSSEYKLVDVREKSPFKLTQNMLNGRALRSMEDVSSSKLLLDVQDGHELETRSNATLPDARDSNSQEQGKVEENSPKESYTVMNNDSALASKAFGMSTGASDSVLKKDVSEPPQKKRAFRMSAHEDYFELDDGLECNGLASRPFDDGRGLMSAHLTDSIAPAEESKSVRTTIQPEVKLPSGLLLSKTSDLSTTGADNVGLGSRCIAFPALEEATAAAQSAVFPVSLAVFDKPKETNTPPPLFGFSSKVADMTSEPIRRTAETKPESSSSMVNVPVPNGSLVKIPKLEKVGQLNPPKGEGTSGKSDTVPSAVSNGPLHSSTPAASFTAASFKGTSTSTASSGSIFGSAAAPSVLGEPVFKFGASVEPSAAVSAASTTIVPVGGDLETKAEIDPSSGSSSSSLSNVVAFGAASSGHGMFGLSPSGSQANNLQFPLSNSASKSFISGVGAVSQGTSAQSVLSPASSPLFNMNCSTSFGFSTSSCSSDTSAVIPSSGPTSSTVIFGVNSNTGLDGTDVRSSSSATPSMFNFGFGSSSSSTSTVGPTGGGATPPVFNFGGSSPASASVVNTASSFSSGTSSIFNFGGSSSSSSTINAASSSSAPSNVFGSSLQSPKSSIFGSTRASASPSTGFSFGSSSTTSAPINAAPIFFNSSTAPSLGPVFSFTTSSSSVLSSQSTLLTQPVFGNAPSGFATSTGNNDQMNGEDSMAEDSVQSTTPSFPVFGQTSVSPSPPGFMFGSTAASQANPFQFSGQQNQVTPQNPAPFQASGSLEFNPGGSFSLGSGGGDKSGRRIVKPSRTKNRRK